MYASLTNIILWTTLGLASGAIFKYIICKKNSKQVLEILLFNELSIKCPYKHVKNKASDRCGKYCNRRQIQQIIQRIDQAVYSIDIAIYTFTTAEFLAAFSRAIARGAVVRVITDPEMMGTSGSKISNLFTSGAEIRMPETTAMMHHKFMVIDHDSRVKHLLRCRDKPTKPQSCASVMFYGSANWTVQGFNGNWENGVITNDKVLLNQFQKEFDRMWGCFKSYSPYKPNN